MRKEICRCMVLVVMTVSLVACVPGVVSHNRTDINGHPVFVGMTVEMLTKALGAPEKVDVEYPNMFFLVTKKEQENLMKPVYWYRYGNYSFEVEDNIVTFISEKQDK